MNFPTQNVLRVSLLVIAISHANRGLADEARIGLSESEKRGGWQMLFDGKSTEGWRNYKSDKISDGWVVKDGLLERVGKGAGDIVTTEQYENFELSLEYRISKSGNSGIMFHVTEDQAQPWHSGPEVQIQDNVDGRDPQKAGWLYQLYKPVKPEWATMFENQVGFKGTDVDVKSPLMVSATSIFIKAMRNGTSELRPVSLPHFLNSERQAKATFVCRITMILSHFVISNYEFCPLMVV